jgi:FHA domain
MQNELMQKQTGKLDSGILKKLPKSARETDHLDLGTLRPWRIALRIQQTEVQLIFDLTGRVMLGRRDAENNTVVNIDLSPFGADELGVSRGHLSMQLEGNSVIITDNHSLNGTYLDGRFLDPGQPHTLRHGAELTLGMMTIQVELLVNPLD